MQRAGKCSGCSKWAFRVIELAWPPSILSGHAKGNGKWKKIVATKQHRKWAKEATKAANIDATIPTKGDIYITFTFYPPDRRSDRCNMPNRLKPAIDGIADALGVNDRRFHPMYLFAEPVENPRVVVTIHESGLLRQLLSSLIEEE